MTGVQTCALPISLVDPRAVCSDTAGNVYVLERGGHALRVVRLDGRIYTVAGNGEKGNSDGGGSAARFNEIGRASCRERV